MAARFPTPDRDVLVTSGTSGGLLLAMLAAVNPGDEVIVPDPYFVTYPHLVTLAGGTAVYRGHLPGLPPRPGPGRAPPSRRGRRSILLLDARPTRPARSIDAGRARSRRRAVRDQRGILLISDEIYRAFHYDGPARSPAEFNEDVLVIEGFGKTYGMTGWRLGYAHGPTAADRGDDEAPAVHVRLRPEHRRSTRASRRWTST